MCSHVHSIKEKTEANVGYKYYILYLQPTFASLFSQFQIHLSKKFNLQLL